MFASKLRDAQGLVKIRTLWLEVRRTVDQGERRLPFKDSWLKLAESWLLS
jgi:hypothetical protein